MTEPKRLLLDVWSWLPAFQAVAQAGSVTGAAKRLSVSPPAISKALKALEARVGRPLFARSNQGVELTESGRALFDAVRTAAAGLEYGLAAAGLDVLETTVRVASMGSLDRSLMMPAAQMLREQHPRLRLSLSSGAAPTESLTALKQGRLDLLLGVNVAVGVPFVSESVASMPMGVYISERHAAFEETLDDDAIAGLAFVAQPALEGMKSVWPRTVPREVKLEVDSHSLALEACRGGGFAMVMGRPFARKLIETGELRELLPGFLEPANVSMILGEDRQSDPALQLVVEATRASARSWELSR